MNAKHVMGLLALMTACGHTPQETREDSNSPPSVYLEAILLEVDRKVLGASPNATFDELPVVETLQAWLPGVPEHVLLTLPETVVLTAFPDEQGVHLISTPHLLTREGEAAGVHIGEEPTQHVPEHSLRLHPTRANAGYDVSVELELHQGHHTRRWSTQLNLEEGTPRLLARLEPGDTHALLLMLTAYPASDTSQFQSYRQRKLEAREDFIAWSETR